MFFDYALCAGGADNRVRATLLQKLHSIHTLHHKFRQRIVTGGQANYMLKLLSRHSADQFRVRQGEAREDQSDDGEQ